MIDISRNLTDYAETVQRCDDLAEEILSRDPSTVQPTEVHLYSIRIVMEQTGFIDRVGRNEKYTPFIVVLSERMKAKTLEMDKKFGTRIIESGKFGMRRFESITEEVA